MQSPLGQYGQPVAAFIAVVVIVAAIASHVIPGVAPSNFLDDLALLAAGVVFGTQVVQNGTQVAATTALAQANAAHARIDALAANVSANTDAIAAGDAKT